MQIYLKHQIEIYPELVAISEQVLVYADSFYTEKQLRLALKNERANEINLFSSKVNLAWLSLYDSHQNISINADALSEEDIVASDKFIVLTNNKALSNYFRGLALKHNKTYKEQLPKLASVGQSYESGRLSNVA